MTDAAISELPEGTAPQPTDVFPFVQSGVTKKIPFSSMSSGLINFTEAGTTTAPNATVPVVSLTAKGTAANLDVVLRPKGTGSIAVDIADGTAAGGNKRGSYSVDFQTTRTAANQVASESYGFIGGGDSNKIEGTHGAILNGVRNRIGWGGRSAILCGVDNIITDYMNPEGQTLYAMDSAICGGALNYITGDYSNVSGGYQNRIYSNLCHIGGGSQNTIGTTLYFLSDGSAIGGGILNTIGNNCGSSVVAGGAENTILLACSKASIGGGYQNKVSCSGGTIPGGHGADTRSCPGTYAWGGYYGLSGKRQTLQILTHADSRTGVPSFLEANGATGGSLTGTSGSLSMLVNSTSYLRIRVLGKSKASDGAVAFTITALLSKGAAGIPFFEAPPIYLREFATGILSTAAVALVVHATSGVIGVQIGQTDSAVISWSAHFEALELTL